MTTCLFKLKENTPIFPDFGNVHILPKETMLWQHGSRASSLGGYIGTYSEAYQHAKGWSPKSGFFQLNKDKVEEA